MHWILYIHNHEDIQIEYLDSKQKKEKKYKNKETMTPIQPILQDSEKMHLSMLSTPTPSKKKILRLQGGFFFRSKR